MEVYTDSGLPTCKGGGGGCGVGSSVSKFVNVLSCR